MNLDNLYKAEKEGNVALLKEIYQENEAVINYFETISTTVQDLLKSDVPDTDKVNSIVNNLQKNLLTLSRIKFLIFEMEDEIPGSLAEKWKKKVNYITKMMSISECETFLKELKDFELIFYEVKEKELFEIETKRLEQAKLEQEKQLKNYEKIERQKKEEQKENKLKQDIEYLINQIQNYNGRYLKEVKSLNNEIESILNKKTLQEQHSVLTNIGEKINQLNIYKLFTTIKSLIKHLEINKVTGSGLEPYEAWAKIHDDAKELYKILLNINLNELLFYDKNDDLNRINIILNTSYVIYGDFIWANRYGIKDRPKKIRTDLITINELVNDPKKIDKLFLKKIESRPL